MEKLHILYCLLYFSTQFYYSSAFHWYCKKNGDCTVQDSVCSSKGICECSDGKIFNTDASECVSIPTNLDYACKDNKQCGEIIRGPVQCRNGMCTCGDGYRYLNSICVPAKRLDESCTDNADCYDGSDIEAMICESNKCVCNKGYYERKGFDCRPSASGTVNETCIFDSDCGSNNLQCKFMGSVGLCVDNTEHNTYSFEYYEISEDLEMRALDLEAICVNDNECAAIENSFCATLAGKCMCKDKFAFHKKTQNCVTAIGETCNKNEDCKLKNSICKNNKCQCEKYFINGYMNNKCYKPTRKLGDSCTSDKNCLSFGRNAICSDRMCVCNQKSKFDNLLNICVESGGGQVQQCEVHEDCNHKKYSECKDKNCVCKPNYREQGDSCLPNLGAACENNECVMSNAECRNKICTCKNNFMPDSDDNQKCIPIPESEDGTCEIDLQCQSESVLGEGGICDENVCVCSPKHILNNGTCVLKIYIGDVCRNLGDCQRISESSHIICRNSKCACAYGYKATKDRTNCYADNGASSVYQGYFALIILMLLTKLYSF